MADAECIPVIDLYKTIIKDCEGVPLRHCHQFQDQPNVVSFQLTLPFIDVSSSARVISSYNFGLKTNRSTGFKDLVSK